LKRLIAVFALALSTVAAAEPTLIFETKNHSDYGVETTFEVNKELGRAWVNVSLSESWGDDTTYDDTRVKVEGLSYDAETKSIVLNRNGETIVCGVIYNRRWVIDIGGSVRQTKRCTFTVKKFNVTEDDGFETYKVPMLQIFMNVQ
jgi:hypothetical protein